MCGLKTLKPDFVFMFWLLSPLPLFAFVWQLHLKAFLSTQLHTEGAHSTQLNLLTGLLIWIGEARQNLLISFSEANHDIETVVVFQSKQTIEFPIFGNTDDYKYGFKV